MTVPECIYVLRDIYKKEIEDFKKEKIYYENQLAFQYFYNYPFDENVDSKAFFKEKTIYMNMYSYYDCLEKKIKINLKETDSLILKWEQDDKLLLAKQ